MDFDWHLKIQSISLNFRHHYYLTYTGSYLTKAPFREARLPPYSYWFWSQPANPQLTPVCYRGTVYYILIQLEKALPGPHITVGRKQPILGTARFKLLLLKRTALFIFLLFPLDITSFGFPYIGSSGTFSLWLGLWLPTTISKGLVVSHLLICPSHAASRHCVLSLSGCLICVVISKLQLFVSSFFPISESSKEFLGVILTDFTIFESLKPMLVCL